MKDLRFKITQEQRLDIIRDFKSGLVKIPQLAKIYGVTYRAIYLITHPEYAKACALSRKGTWKKWYTTERAKRWKKDFRARRKEDS